MCKGGENMKSVSEQRERIIGLKSEMPKAKDVSDGTIYENLTDGTVNVAYHGTWYEKKNDVDLTEVNNNIEKRLPFLHLESSVADDGKHKISFPLDFIKNGKPYYGIVCNTNAQIPQLFTVIVTSFSCWVRELTTSPLSSKPEFGTRVYGTPKICTITNNGNTDEFYLDIFNYPY